MKVSRLNRRKPSPLPASAIHSPSNGSTTNGNGHSKTAPALKSSTRSTSRNADIKLFAWIRETLYVPAVCDILDDMGLRQQAMHQRVRPLDPENCTIVGRARTF